MLVAICDDYIEQANEIKDKITGIHPEITVDVYQNIDDFFAVIKENSKKYFAIFMDMEWQGNAKSGVDYVSELHNMKCRSKIICVTAYTMKYIEKLFWNDVKIFGVLNKPVDNTSMEKILDKLIQSEEASKEILTLRYNDSLYKFSVNEIIYVQSEGHKTVINTLEGPKSFYMSFKSIRGKLPASFYCINKGILVNMKYVKRIEQDEVILSIYGESVELPVARNKKKDFRDTFFEYISR
ncbi:MAG: LytR/AlgR family response regulator transcription factor [Lachnospiraceae bacterium]